MSLQEHIGLLASIVRKDYPTARRYVTASGFNFASFEDFIAKNQLSGWLYSALVVSPVAEWLPGTGA